MNNKINYVYAKTKEEIKYIEKQLGDEAMFLFMDDEFYLMCKKAIASYVNNDYPFIYLFQSSIPSRIKIPHFVNFMLLSGVNVECVDLRVTHLSKDYKGLLFTLPSELIKCFKFYDNFNKVKGKSKNGIQRMFTKNVFGYRRYKKKGLVHIEIDPSESCIVLDMHLQYSKCKSVNATRKFLVSKYGDKAGFSNQTVRRMLNNDIYVGKLTIGDKIEYDDTLRIVNLALKEKVKRMLKQRGSKKSLLKGKNK